MQSTSFPNANAAPGTHAYLPGLVARARVAHPDLPLEPIILQSLLLCLIAQPRLPSRTIRSDHDTGPHVRSNLVLRTKEEDVALVLNLASMTLQHILGVTAHKHKVSSKSGVQGHVSTSTTQVDHPDAFLRSLLFRRVPHIPPSHPTSQLRGNSTARLGSAPLPGAAKSPRGHVPQRSSSFIAVSTDGEEDERFFDASSLASSRRPLLAGQTPASTRRSQASKGRPVAHKLRTDPLPLSSMFTPLSVGETEESVRPAAPSANGVRAQRSVSTNSTNESGGTALAIPRAIVVSGLEHASIPCQRALMRVLTERRIVFDGAEYDDTDLSGRDLDAEDGTWNLPDGFVVVYVCPSDPHERPAILRGLLDRFSMSADVNLHPSIRQSYLSYRASLAPTPRGTPIPSPLALPNTGHSYIGIPTPVHHSPVRHTTPLPASTPLAPPVISASELANLRTLARPYPVAAPIFYPSVHATTQLSAITPLPARPPPYAALGPSLDKYLLDLFAATRHYPALDGTLLTMRAHMDAEALARAFRVINGDTTGATLVYHEAQMGDRETVAADSLDRLDMRSAGWECAESLGRRARRNGDANADREERKSSDEFEGEHGVSLRVDDEDNSYAGGFEALLSMPRPELIPAEALDAAIERSWPEVWDVSEEDVARIFPRVVSHRLRVRDGPDDELLGSVVWPACRVDGDRHNTGAAEDDGAKLGWERLSVKELLVRILADV